MENKYFKERIKIIVKILFVVLIFVIVGKYLPNNNKMEIKCIEEIKYVDTGKEFKRMVDSHGLSIKCFN